MKSKELKEIEAEEMDQEPSLDKLIDLNDPKVLSGLGRLATTARLRQESDIDDGYERKVVTHVTDVKSNEPNPIVEGAAYLVIGALAMLFVFGR